MMIDFEPGDERRTLGGQSRAAALESVLGMSEVAPGDLAGRPGSVAGVEVLLFRNHLDGVVAASSGLIGRDDQIANDLGNYELAVACRRDDRWGAEVVRDLAGYTLRASLDPGDTISLAAWVPAGCNLVAFLCCEYARFKVRGRDAGLMLLIGVTAGELSRCRNGLWREVEAGLKAAGVYPFTDPGRTDDRLARPRTLAPGAGARAASLSFIALPPLVVWWSLGAWYRVLRLLGARVALRESVRISRIRFRQPLRYMKRLPRPDAHSCSSVSCFPWWSWGCGITRPDAYRDGILRVRCRGGLRPDGVQPSASVGPVRGVVRRMLRHE